MDSFFEDKHIVVFGLKDIPKDIRMTRSEWFEYLRWLHLPMTLTTSKMTKI